MTLIVRFDDWAEAPSGEQIYANRTMLLARTRWGRIVEQEDFYEDTGRILELERRLWRAGRRARPAPGLSRPRDARRSTARAAPCTTARIVRVGRLRRASSEAPGAPMQPG